MEIVDPLVIEFAGLVGAGKSTLANLVGRELQARGITCGTRQEVNIHSTSSQSSLLRRAVTKGRRILDADRLWWHASVARYATLVSRPDRDRRTATRHLKNFVTAMRDAVHGRAPALWVFDEGVAQRTMGLGAGILRENARVLRALLRSTLRQFQFRVIVVDVTVENAWQRILERQARTGRANVWCSEEGRAMLDGFQVTLDLLAECLDAEGLLLCRVDSSAGLTGADSDACCDEIERELRRHNSRQLVGDIGFEPDDRAAQMPRH